MNELALLKDDFQAQLEADPQSVEVKLKNGKTLKVYWKPSNLKTRDAIFKRVGQGTLEAMALTVVKRALREDGERMFKEADLFELMNSVDPNVIADICKAMNAPVTVEDAEKHP